MNRKNDTTKIFIGLDVHTTNYTISFYNYEDDRYFYETTLEADDKALIKYIRRIIKRHYSDDDYEFLIGYEAGYLGYETYRNLDCLKKDNVECVIIAPNTIKRSPKQKKLKNDLLDARLIAKTLSNKDYSAVHVPTPEDEAVMRLLRLRDSIQKDITAAKNRLQASLVQLGFKYSGSSMTKWTVDYVSAVVDFIEQQDEIDKFCLEKQLENILWRQKDLEQVDKKIEEQAQKEEYAQKVKELCALKGINILTAINIIVTVGDVSRFKTAKSFANYLGLTPGEHSSGEHSNTLGITKAGNTRLRRLLVLSAQAYGKGSSCYKSKDLLRRQEDLDGDFIRYVDKASKRLHKKFKHLRDDLNKAYNMLSVLLPENWPVLSGAFFQVKLLLELSIVKGDN